MQSLVENIVNCYLKADSAELSGGRNWYAEANAFARKVSQDTGVPFEAVVGVIALTSPQAHWDRNMASTVEICNGQECRFVTRAMRRKCDAVINGASFESQVAKGQKIRAFYNCILGLDDVCVDTHAINLAHGERQSMKYRTSVWASLKLYQTYREAYRDAAKLLGVPASTVQAVTWVTWRNQHGRA